MNLPIQDLKKVNNKHFKNIKQLSKQSYLRKTNNQSYSLQNKFEDAILESRKLKEQFEDLQILKEKNNQQDIKVQQESSNEIKSKTSISNQKANEI